MKIRLALAGICFLVAVALCDCTSLQNQVVSETVTKSPDGTVTTTTIKATNSDAALEAGSNLASAVARAAIPRIIADK